MKTIENFIRKVQDYAKPNIVHPGSNAYLYTSENVFRGKITVHHDRGREVELKFQLRPPPFCTLTPSPWIDHPEIQIKKVEPWSTGTTTDIFVESNRVGFYKVKARHKSSGGIAAPWGPWSEFVVLPEDHPLYCLEMKEPHFRFEGKCPAIYQGKAYIIMFAPSWRIEYKWFQIGGDNFHWESSVKSAGGLPGPHEVSVDLWIDPPDTPDQGQIGIQSIDNSMMDVSTYKVNCQ